MSGENVADVPTALSIQTVFSFGTLLLLHERMMRPLLFALAERFVAVVLILQVALERV